MTSNLVFNALLVDSTNTWQLPKTEPTSGAKLWPPGSVVGARVSDARGFADGSWSVVRSADITSTPSARITNVYPSRCRNRLPMRWLISSSSTNSTCRGRWPCEMLLRTETGGNGTTAAAATAVLTTAAAAVTVSSGDAGSIGATPTPVDAAVAANIAESNGRLTTMRGLLLLPDTLPCTCFENGCRVTVGRSAASMTVPGGSIVSTPDGAG
jgi:hypothetical protein